MKTNDLVTLCSTALATGTLTVFLFWSGPAHADRDALAPAAVAQPTLSVNGLTVTLALAEARTYAAGERPVVILRATNAGKERLEASVRIDMTASSPRDRFSRVPAMARPLWQQEQCIAVMPGAAVEERLTAPALPAGSEVAFALSSTNPFSRIVSLTLTTPATAPQLAAQ